MEEYTKVVGTETKNGHTFALRIIDINPHNMVKFSIWCDDDNHPFVEGSTPAYRDREEAMTAIMNIGIGFAETGILPNFTKCGILAPNAGVCHARPHRTVCQNL